MFIKGTGEPLELLGPRLELVSGVDDTLHDIELIASVLCRHSLEIFGVACGENFDR